MKKSVQKFEIGDQVKWSSQAKGYETVKKGVIFAVIREGQDPTTLRGSLNPGARKNGTLGTYREAFGGGIGRNHESYVVRVPSGSVRRKDTLYWPRVNQLSKVTN